MPFRLENDLEKRVVAWAQGRGILPFKLNLQGNTGWPDRLWLFVYPAMAFIEFKRPGRPAKPERNQPARIAELERRGYPVGVFNDFAAAVTFLEATVLSGSGGGADDKASLCRLVMEAGTGEDERSVRGVSHPSRKRIR